jgi:mannose-1-phosphate guanylyltransferase/mannose-6-phosphate isomerase
MIKASPVILCGGSGTRLWPLSRTGFPKQFLCLTGKESLFQQAALRLAMLGSEDIQVSSPYIVSGEDHRFLVSEQLREIGVELGGALLEPVGRNTAPALTLAALAATEGTTTDPVLVVTPSDQTVANTEAFTAAMQQAVLEAANGTIVILGVTPNKPETGYGYIQTAKSLRGETEAILIVKRFVEKPDAPTAKTYLNEGGYYWNAGMFVLRASVWLKALEQFRPDILQATQSAWNKRSSDNQFVRPGKDEFTVIPSESVDYAAMEHCPGSSFSIKMVPLDAGWNDLGAWDAVWNVLPKDEAGNTHLGDVVTTDSRNTLVHATSRLVGLVGVENLIVVEAPDAVLVADKSRSQDVKHIVTQLQKTKREEHMLQPQDAYALSKLEAEQALLALAAQTDMEVVIIRPPLVYGTGAPGNFASLVRWVRGGLPLPLGAVHNQRSLVALDNLVSLVLLCADRVRSPKAANQVFVVCDGEDVSTPTLLRKVAQAVGRSSRLLPVPERLLRAGARLAGKRAVADRLLGNLQVDDTKVRKLLGWRPITTMDKQLATMFDVSSTERMPAVVPFGGANSPLLRWLDILLAGSGLLVLWPVLLLVCMAVWFDTRSPLFTQERVGRHQQSFVLIKFRTMWPGTASVASHLASSESVTRMGRFLRRTKLDELPQLWNVLLGHMSLVGPRPGLVNQQELTQFRTVYGVFSARPGITGLAQINGIDMSTPKLLAQTDAKMLRELNLKNYFKFIFMTIFGKGSGDAVKK